jgi:hypothetical protein
MRAFQPIARRTQAERNRNLWVPSPTLRKIAWRIVLGSLAYDVIAGWRIAFYIFAVQRNPTYALTHSWQASPFLIFAQIAMLVCIPFVTSRGPRSKKKHVPDPALSILPR